MNKNIQKLTYSALYLAIALVLPFLTGQIPQIGSMLCPMHIPALLCGFVCGWGWGLAVGFIAPLLRSVLFGMPDMFPTAVSMAFELAIYGAAAGALYRALPRKTVSVYLSLIIAMIAGRLVWGVMRYLLAGLVHSTFTPALFLGRRSHDRHPRHHPAYHSHPRSGHCDGQSAAHSRLTEGIFMNSDNQTRAFLLAHCQAYPRLELTDLFKALYQSACGCEHLVGDASAAAAYITDEAASCKPHSGAVIEPLDGEYVRVHLDILKDGLNADTFARLFACSAEHHDGAKPCLRKSSTFCSALPRRARSPFRLKRPAPPWTHGKKPVFPPAIIPKPSAALTHPPTA